jgi:hypothetical protein
MDLSLFEREGAAVGRGRCHLGRRVESEQLPAGFAAAEHNVEKPGIAMLVLHGPLSSLRADLTIDDRRLAGLLRPFPGGPSFTLQTLDAGQFHVASRIEVSNRRLSPGDADLLQVRGYLRLADGQFPADGVLGPALQEQVGDPLPPLHDLEFAGRFNRHAGPRC